MSAQQEIKLLNELIRRIYKAAVEPHEWKNIFEILTDYFQLSTATYLEHDTASKDPKVFHYSGLFDHAALSDYENYYGPRSPALKNLSLYREGTVFTDRSLPNYQEYIESETYNDFFKKYESEHMMCLVTKRNFSTVNYLPLRRSQDIGFFSDKEINFAEFLMPHLTQAGQISQQFQQHHELNTALQQTFENIAMGVVILNKDEVVYTNTAAESILSCNDGLTIKNRQLIARLQTDSNKLRDALFNIFHSASSNPITLMATSISIARENERKPYLVTVLPLVNNETLDGGEKHAIVTIHDPESQPINNIELLIGVYELTMSEALVTKALCNGFSVSDIAVDLSCSENAVRFHIKNIFQKLHVNRQTELVSMILKGPLGHLFHG